MPWQEETVMSLRTEFVEAHQHGDESMQTLCQRFGISRKTGYKWLRRYQEGGPDSLEDRSRRPHTSPVRTSVEVEGLILAARASHPAWGARKIRAWLEARGHKLLPSPSTITAILHRYERIDPVEAQKHRPFQRFVMEEPNQLWQMDFKGYLALAYGRCHPLTMLDDHSRYLLGLHACPDETQPTVRHHLCAAFREYGLPERMLMDNGPPWGCTADQPYTGLTIWLMRLGVAVTHGRPYHPQTQGKEERLHRTLQAELLRHYSAADLEGYQRLFDAWRQVYNQERPHEALGMDVPAAHYRPSMRPFPEQLSPVVYQSGDVVRIVDKTGRISFQNRPLRIGKAFRGQQVALRPTEIDGQYAVYFCQVQIRSIDLRENC
jgi:transposase InsO family protein